MRPTLLAIASLVVAAACGQSPPAEPRAPVLGEMRGTDLRCQPPDGGIGVKLDGRCVPLVLRGSDPDNYSPRLSDESAADAAARAVGAQCKAESNAATGDGATFVGVTCGKFHGAVPGLVVRVDRDGRIHKVAIPASGGARLTFVAGARPILVAVLDDVGTMVFDARTLAGLAGWQRMGGWFNAATAGAGASPDGRWFAVPDPYGMRIDLVRASDLALVGSIGLQGLTPRDQGPGQVTWPPYGLEVGTFPLPYE